MPPVPSVTLSPPIRSVLAGPMIRSANRRAASGSVASIIVTVAVAGSSGSTASATSSPAQGAIWVPKSTRSPAT